jgi:hypothetical protein
MALYLAKLHGRNRAYGIRSLSSGDADTLARVERDLDCAWRDGLVDLHVLHGSDAPALAAAAESAAMTDG